MGRLSTLKLLPAVALLGLLTVSGCGEPSSSSTLQTEQSGLGLERKKTEECCLRRCPPGRDRHRCLEDCAHGRLKHVCDMRPDAGGRDASPGDGGRADASRDALPDGGDAASADAGSAACPSILSVSPASEDLPDFSDVVINVTAADPNPNDVLTFTWSTTGGTLVPEGTSSSTPAADFRCTGVGPQTITITVSNGTCGSSASITINCVAHCGNNVVEPGEDCDPPNLVPNGRILCDASCHFVGTCGNGNLDPGEQCDPPSPGRCGNDCQLAAVCGDGIVGPGEQCDPPHQGPEGGQCGPNCQHLTCGNFQLDPGEQCDPPTSASIDRPACTQDCQIPTCGNLVLDPGEMCDPPNGVTCDGSCQPIPIVCGDGIVQPGESCDFPSTAFCNLCQVTTCGGCFFAATGGSSGSGDPVCRSLTGTARTACQQLLACMSQDLGACALGGVAPAISSAPVTYCYCTDATCSAGLNGQCVAQVNAVAGTSDLALVLAQLSDPTSVISRVRNEALAFSSFGCGFPCSMH